MDDYGILYKKIEAQDKIINTQALEIARLKEENLEIARLRPLVDLLKEENNGVRKSFNDLQQKINKAIEYNQIILDSDYVYSQDEIAKKNLEILGDKENE